MSKPQALIEQVRSSVAVELERRHAPPLLADRKAAKAAKAAVSTTEAGRVGNRPYARGRAYKPDRYEESE